MLTFKAPGYSSAMQFYLTKGEMGKAFVFLNGTRREFPLLLSSTSLFNVLNVFFDTNGQRWAFCDQRITKRSVIPWENTQNDQPYSFVHITFDDFFPQTLTLYNTCWVLSEGSHVQGDFLHCFFYFFSCFPLQSVLELIDIIFLRRLNHIPTLGTVKFVFRQLEMFKMRTVISPFGTGLTAVRLNK